MLLMQPVVEVARHRNGNLTRSPEAVWFQPCVYLDVRSKLLLITKREGFDIE